MVYYTYKDVINMKNKIRVLYHSSIKIDDGKILYFDPYNIKKAENDADYIFITHDHYDHYSPEDIEKVIKKDTVIFAPTSLENEFPGKFSIFMKAVDVFQNQFIKVEAVPAYNIGKKFHPKENAWNGYIVTLNNIRYYIAGDTDITPDNKNVKCDVALVPVGGKYTMNYKEAAILVNKLKPQLAVPTHFGGIVGTSFDGEKFKSLLLPKIRCDILTEKFD